MIRPDAIGHQQAVRLVELFRRFPVQDLTSGMMMAALDARQRFQLSYRDAAIIEASPRAMGCTQVLSEDLGGRQDHGGVRSTGGTTASSSAWPRTPPARKAPRLDTVPVWTTPDWAGAACRSPGCAWGR